MRNSRKIALKTTPRCQRSRSHQNRGREYKALIGIGIPKKDAEQVARDPGVKKNEWGWICEDEGRKLTCVKGEGAKYKNNAVCE
jgi:hypothetical protein